MQHTIALSLTLLVALAGCVSYTASPAPAPQAESMPIWNTEGAVRVGVDPYTQPARQATIFGGDLSAVGIIPIQVFVQNQEERRLVIRPSDMMIELPDGSQIISTGASTAAMKLERSHGAAVPATVFLGFAAAAVTASSEDKARAARLQDYRRKELQDTQLRKGESAHGFVYFSLPAGTPAFTDATLIVRLVDFEEATSFAVRLPLRDVGFKGVPLKAE